MQAALPVSAGSDSLHKESHFMVRGGSSFVSDGTKVLPEVVAPQHFGLPEPTRMAQFMLPPAET